MKPDEFTDENDAPDAELAARGRMLVAAAVAETRAPMALRERIEADRARAAARPRRRVRWLPLAGLAAAVAAVLVALVVAGGGRARRPDAAGAGAEQIQLEGARCERRRSGVPLLG